jgi:hypothetical protein
MKGINTWWEHIPGERFWLGIPRRERGRDVLAAPRGARRNNPYWSHPLIACVKDGDAVFQYDEASQAIVSWSVSRGRARKKGLVWSGQAEGQDPEWSTPHLLPSWEIELEKSSPLDTVVPLDQIARIQWDLFSALRAFEDKVGQPLYYPFAMGSPSETHLLSGHVFKLPMLFVECFSALARVAEYMRRSAAANGRAAERPRATVLQVVTSPAARVTVANRNEPALASRPAAHSEA